MIKETTSEKFIREFTQAFAEFNIKITALTFDEAFMTKEQKLQFLVRSIEEINDMSRSISKQLRQVGQDEKNNTERV